MENLQGKVAVITGAASGIGKAVATRAAGEGMKVVLADIEENALKEAADELAAGGAEVIAAVTDVSDVASVRELRDRTLREFGAVHLVHNNAGVGTGGPIWDVPEEDWRWILGVNLWGVVHGIATFVPLFIQQGEGHVVNTASIAGLTTAPFLGPYNATKQAVVAISETLYKDLEAAGSRAWACRCCVPALCRPASANPTAIAPRGRPNAMSKGAEGMRGLIQAW